MSNMSRFELKFCFFEIVHYHHFFEIYNFQLSQCFRFEFISLFSRFRYIHTQYTSIHKNIHKNNRYIRIVFSNTIAFFDFYFKSSLLMFFS